ncbi:MAG: hypothetical protein ACRCX2_00690 [Paraclostridium sp.]
MTYEKLFELLPSALKEEGVATNFKKILEVYAETTSYNDEESIRYGNMLDIYGAKNGEIDFIGNMYSVFRNTGETDYDYRERIISTIISRRTPVTLPEIQQAVDSVVDNGKLYVLENHQGKPANIFITGTANEDSIRRTLSLTKEFLPAGVGLFVPIVSFPTWQSIRDQFTTWQSLKDRDFIW